MPLDRGIIDQQLQALREGTSWWEEREFRDLPTVLHADERILALARGKIARVRVLRRVWLIVVTDQRLICLRSAKGGSRRQLEIGADQIARVSLRVGPFRGRVLVSAPDRSWRLLVRRGEAYRLHAALSGIAHSADDVFPGFASTRMVRRVVDHVLALPAVALHPDLRALPTPAAEPAVSEERVHSLEEQVQELKQQVAFLEQLLRQRQGMLP